MNSSAPLDEQVKGPGHSPGRKPAGPPHFEFLYGRETLRRSP
jgi:hypothetical protein